MRKLPLVPAALLAASLAAQDGVVYYKFDATDATEVLNHAGGPNAGPRFGTLSWPAAMAYGTGWVGGGLERSGHVGTIGHFVRSGWTGGLQGSMTVAFALENRGANTPVQYSPVAGQPDWSIATGGSAGSGLELSGAGLGNVPGDFGAALCTLTGWNHFAVVVDAAAGTATWYRNGAAVSTVPVAGPAAIPVQDELLVGTDYQTICGGLYAIDEFRLLDRAASSQEIAAFAASTTATAVTFGTQTATVLDPVGVPAIGDPTFAARLADPQAQVFALLAGLSYVSHGSLQLPADLSLLAPAVPGAELLVAPQSVHIGLFSGGEASVALPIPNLPGLAGTTLLLQGLVLDAQDRVAASNAVAAGVGAAGVQ